jgi:pyruvate/2-oxoglutarate dehydrogenase complex dihydrolipoamide dehydrogenase (E3) component
MTDSIFKRVTVLPIDEYNQQLVSFVHPPDWINPTPAPRYDLVVIGAGTAGLVVAAGAAGLGLGLKVALVERYLMGGDCLNVGCVPSKSIIRSSRVVADIRHANSFGIHPPENIEIDFGAVMQRMRKIRAGISHHDSAERFQKLGVDVFLGQAQFVNGEVVTVGDKALRFKKAVITTGARAVKPPIAGIEEVGYLTNETVFSLTQRPQRLAVIGGGPIGCEMAQTFQRLGSSVTLIERGTNLLNREDTEAAAIVQNTFSREGIELLLNCSLKRAELTSEGKKLYFDRNGTEGAIAVDEILIGAGRAPNVEGLNLEAAGVRYDRAGVTVNDYLETSNPKIYAAGDICLQQKFTHVADATARIVIKNAFFSPFGLGKSKVSDLIVPWVTYTDPEVAHVGMYEAEARAKGIATSTIKIDLSSVDRAIADSEEDGFVKILHQAGKDKILGATIVARHAGETISEITTAMVGGMGLSALSSVIHPYPTQAEAIKKAADAYRRTLLTPRSKTLLGFLTKLSGVA